jgi:predicted nucleic acid-binding protein
VMRAVLVDTSVFAYALGGDHVMRGPCVNFLQRARHGEFQLHASVEMVQERTSHRMRRSDRSMAVEQGRLAGRACVLHPFDEAVLARALELIATTEVGGRDAVHAATAAEAGLSTIVSTDQAFDAVMQRLDPVDL